MINHFLFFCVGLQFFSLIFIHLLIQRRRERYTERKVHIYSLKMALVLWLSKFHVYVVCIALHCVRCRFVRGLSQFRSVVVCAWVWVCLENIRFYSMVFHFASSNILLLGFNWQTPCVLASNHFFLLEKEYVHFLHCVSYTCSLLLYRFVGKNMKDVFRFDMGLPTMKNAIASNGSSRILYCASQFVFVMRTCSLTRSPATSLSPSGLLIWCSLASSQHHMCVHK